MRTFRLALLLITLALAGCRVVAYGGDAQAVADAGSRHLCEALSSIEPGESMRVRTSGILVISFERQVFYDPAERLCRADVQPATWLDLAGSTKIEPSLEKILRDDGRAMLTVEGILHGPGKVKVDDLSMPPMVAYANRIRDRRYGHLNAFRTQLVVEKVVHFERVAQDVPTYGESAVARPPSRYPVLTGASVPTYPNAALKVGITGEVVVDVAIRDGAVVRADVKSGDRILAVAVIENIQTWRFQSGTNATFTTKFIFELEQRQTGADANPKIDLRLPAYVRMVAPRNDW